MKIHIFFLFALFCFRFIAIVFPMKAHIVCTRRKVLYVIAIVWSVSLTCGLPTVIFNRLTQFPQIPGAYQCQIVFPEPHIVHFLAFKLVEAALFYFVPLVVQVVLYSVVARRLYASTEELHSRFQMRPDTSTTPLNGGGNRNGWNSSSDRAADTIRARKGVVKMLMASVAVYTISYSPHQAHLLYNTFSTSKLPETWHFFVFVMIMTHINSAANPVLYSIFSQNFRRNFKRYLCYMCLLKKRELYRRTRFDSFDSRGISRRVSTTRTTISRV